MAGTTRSKNRVAANGEQPTSPQGLQDLQAGLESLNMDGMHITIPKIEPKTLLISVRGTTPLLVCAWSEKAKRMILDKQEHKANKARPPKNPHEDYMNALYTSTDGWTGVPAGGIKGSLVNACRAVSGLPMTLAKRMIFVKAQGYTKDGQGLVRIYGEHHMHQGMVRIDNGKTADIRFRPEYKKWGAQIEIDFLSNVISAEQVANLVMLAGYIEGWCEHRPGAPKSNTGDLGRFEIIQDPDEVMQMIGA